MRSFAVIALLSCVAGCGRDSAQGDSVNTVDTVMVFTAQPTLSPADSVRVDKGLATVPDQFRGTWAGSQAKCGAPSESSLSISADRVDFYASRGRVLAVKITGERDVEVELESSGEGQVWRSTRRFTLSEDTRSLTDVTTQYHTVRVRCD
jgi:hypothetical protein